jgi:hypothetical protein
MEIDEGSALVVGDYDGSSVLASVQFIEFRDERQIVTSPDDTLTLEKVDPVTLFGFAPAPIAFDKKAPRPGQNITVVGYGSNSSWDWNGDTEYPGVAMEAKLQVLEIEYCKEALSDSSMSDATVFCAGASHADPPFSSLAAGLAHSRLSLGFIVPLALTPIQSCTFLFQLGDYGAPALDNEGNLVGLVTEDMSMFFSNCGSNLLRPFLMFAPNRNVQDVTIESFQADSSVFQSTQAGFSRLYARSPATMASSCARNWFALPRSASSDTLRP